MKKQRDYVRNFQIILLFNLKKLLYIREGKYEEARKIGKRFPNDSTIQSQMVTIHMKTGEDEKAKEIGEKFPDNPTIQFQVLNIYIREGEYKKAKEIRTMFPENLTIQTKSEMLVKTPESILTKINDNPNDPTLKEEIEKLEDKWLKVVFNSAIADKINIKAPAQNFIKELKKQGFVDEEHKAMIQVLEQRLQQKAKIFDMEFYERLIEQILKCNSKTCYISPKGEER